MNEHPSEPALEEPLDPEQAGVLLEALALAARPEPITVERHEAIVRATVLAAADEQDDPFRTPTEQERRDAELLARALEGSAKHTDADLARSLGLAFGRRGDDDARAATRTAERTLSSRGFGTSRRRNVLVVAFGIASGALAIAASALLVLRSAPVEDARAPDLVLSRSLAPLFAPEAAPLEPSARLDRIAEARARDFRNNRYAAWGLP